MMAKRMKKNLRLLKIISPQILILALLFTNLYGYTTVQNFLKQFNIISFKHLEIYCDEKNARSSSLLNKDHIKWVKSPDNLMYIEKAYKLYSFKIDKNITAYAIYYQETVHSQVFLYLFDEKNKFLDSVLVAEKYGYESGFGDKESWISDYNKDGNLDILTRVYDESTVSTGDENYEKHYTEKMILKIWNGKGFVEKGNILIRDEKEKI